MTNEQNDQMVNHPTHYTKERIPVTIYLEPIDLCELYDFNVGNAMKYLLRAKNKGNYVQDLMKAQWYLLREKELLVEQLCNGDENGPIYTPSISAIYESYRKHNHFIKTLINDSGYYSTVTLIETADLIEETIHENERADDTRLFHEGD